MTKRCAALVRLSCVPSDFSQSSSVIAVVAWGSPARLGSARLGCALEVNVRLVCIHQWFDMCAVSTWTVFPAKYLLSFQMNCPQLLTTVLWTQSWSHMHRGPVGPARENFVALPWQQDAYTHTHTHTHTHTAGVVMCFLQSICREQSRLCTVMRLHSCRTDETQSLIHPLWHFIYRF